jgi:hypothetical protein
MGAASAAAEAIIRRHRAGTPGVATWHRRARPHGVGPVTYSAEIGGATVTLTRSPYGILGRSQWSASIAVDGVVVDATESRRDGSSAALAFGCAEAEHAVQARMTAERAVRELGGD